MSKEVKVTVVVILASEKGDQVDRQLKNIAEEVRSANPSFKSFKFKHMESRSLAPEEKSTFELVDNQKALVIVKHGADKEDKVGLAITPPGQGEIIYRSVCGKFLPIITPYQTRDNERLILAVRVQPCNKK